MSRKRPIKYSGQTLDVEWSGRLCIHIGECGRAKGELFETGRKPWCQPDLASDEEVEEVVERCPTGALSYAHKDASKTEQACGENTVHVVYNGPLYFKGDLDIDADTEGAPGLAFRAALCRCGHSKNKPYCDNSHDEAAFRDYGAVGDTGGGLDEVGGKLTVKPVPDGPIMVKGNVSITSGSGRVAWQGKQAALCRCGASANKPFCDGAHKGIGFKS
jgi:CDGSH-type Zn-finger protein/uncharacterized Fe-S cluster protein YjdI